MTSRDPEIAVSQYGRLS